MDADVLAIAAEIEDVDEDVMGIASQLDAPVAMPYERRGSGQPARKYLRPWERAARPFAIPRMQGLQMHQVRRPAAGAGRVPPEADHFAF